MEWPEEGGGCTPGGEGAVADRAVWAGPGAIHCLGNALCHLPHPLKKFKKLKQIKKFKKSKVHPGPMCVQTGASDRMPRGGSQEGSGEESGSYEGLGLGG